MCSIIGMFPVGSQLIDTRLRGPLYRAVMKRAFARGKDAGGYLAVHRVDNLVVPYVRKSVRGSLPLLDCEGIQFHRLIALLQNNRAEPTNEFKATKVYDDIMPFEYDDIYVVHNGTIPNDADILVDHPGERPTSIDSYAIPYAIRKARFADLKGSLAVAWIDMREAKQSLRLHLYRNYQPLSVIFLVEEQLYLFGSLLEYLVDPAEELGLAWQPIHFPPYSKLVIDSVGSPPRLHEETKFNHKAIVVCSGGLDSTVAATVACQENEEVTLAHFRYGCRAEEREVQAVRQIALDLQAKFPHMKVNPQFMDLSFLKQLGGATIIDGQDKDIGGGIEGTERCIDWVPARNTAMMGLVASYCDRHDIGNIYLGLNLEESGAYCDNTIIFHRAFSEVLALGTHARPRIVNPLDNMMKRDIVHLGVQIGAPIEHSWSCYRGGERHCGRCGPCQMRQTAFRMNGFKEMIDYETWFHEEIKP